MNPQYPLDVVGNVNISGNYFQNGVAFNSSTSNFNSLYASNATINGNINITGNILQNGTAFVSSPYVASGVINTTASQLAIQTQGSTTMTITNGYVGVNTVPAHTLDIAGDINVSGNILQNGSIYTPSVTTNVGANIVANNITTSNVTSVGIYLIPGGGVSPFPNGSIPSSGGSNFNQLTASNIQAGNINTSNVTSFGLMLIPSSGGGVPTIPSVGQSGYNFNQLTASNISIGATTSSPYPLQVSSTSANGTSANFTGTVIAANVSTPSDARIKQNIKTTNKNEAIALIKALRPVEYEFIGNNNKARGFIAQELATMFPECIKTISEFIPNVCTTVDVKWLSSDQAIFQNSSSFNNASFKEGDSIKASSGSSTLYFEVVKILDEGVQVSVESATRFFPDRIYVIGTLVHDFHTISYQPIISALVAAVQSLL